LFTLETPEEGTRQGKAWKVAPWLYLMVLLSPAHSGGVFLYLLGAEKAKIIATIKNKPFSNR
jgi:hypothetical protein